MNRKQQFADIKSKITSYKLQFSSKFKKIKSESQKRAKLKADGHFEFSNIDDRNLLTSRPECLNIWNVEFGDCDLFVI
jgi:hypothetical protein